jgi:type IV secretion system protein VirD4
MFIKLALSGLFAEEPPKPHVLPPVLFMLDEFGNLGHIQEVVRALNISRDYRVQLWMLMQYENQLREENYPKNYSAFFSGAGALSYFSARDDVTAESMSKLAGNRQIEMVSRNKNGGSLLTGFLNPKNVSFGESASMQMFPLLPPEEARRIPPGWTFNVIDPTPMPWMLETPGYWTFPDMVAALDPNPF